MLANAGIQATNRWIPIFMGMTRLSWLDATSPFLYPCLTLPSVAIK